MTANVVAQVVARLFAATGRRYDEATLQVWAESLSDETDDDAIESAIDYIVELPPSSAPAVSAYLAVRHRRARRRALAAPRRELEAARPDPATAKERLAQIRAELDKRRSA